MAIEQLPGDAPLKFVSGDDYLLRWNIPFDASGYSWEVTAHHVNEGEINIPYSATVQTSVLTYLYTSFQASITSLLDVTANGKYHSWKVKYTDVSSVVRTFLSGTIEVI